MRIATRLCLAVAVVCLLLAGTAAVSSRSDLTIETDAATYCSGDTVCFTITNNSDSTLWISNMPGWSVWEAAADTLIFPLYVLWAMWSIDPDSSVMDCWPQIDYHLNQVPQGKYYVTIDGVLGNGGPSASAVDTFTITGASSVSPTSWSEAKSRWR